MSDIDFSEWRTKFNPELFLDDMWYIDQLDRTLNYIEDFPNDNPDDLFSRFSVRLGTGKTFRSSWYANLDLEELYLFEKQILAIGRKIPELMKERIRLMANGDIKPYKPVLIPYNGRRWKTDKTGRVLDEMTIEEIVEVKKKYNQL